MAIPGPSIAKPVPIEQADAERQKLYGPLIAQGGGDQKLDMNTVVAPEVTQPVMAAMELQVEDKFFHPTEEDKQAFLRALLGGLSYERRYKLFGKIDAAYVDASTDQREKMYGALEKDAAEKKISTDTDDTWEVWLERYSLACNLREYKQAETGVKSYPPTDDMNARVTELMKLPKPLYQALMQANRCFESVVNELTQKAMQENFWQTGGAVSQLRRT